MKNKEIEELLNILKKCAREEKATLKLNEIACKTILSYIEQLETDYKEANESVTWWTNRFNAIEKDNRNLKNNRDKAIDELSYMSTDAYVEDYDIRDKHWNLLMNILKGDSDDE